jgi:hypothetical protein
MKIKKRKTERLAWVPEKKTGLTQVLANVRHNGCFTSTFLDNFCCVSYLFLNIQSITKLTK